MDLLSINAFFAKLIDRRYYSSNAADVSTALPALPGLGYGAAGGAQLLPEQEDSSVLDMGGDVRPAPPSLPRGSSWYTMTGKTSWDVDPQRGGRLYCSPRITFRPCKAYLYMYGT